MNWLKSKKTIVTHSGNFHPDDVFAVALLSILFKGQIKIIRTRDDSKYASADFVVDTGLVHDPKINRFDHHQEGNAGFRVNGISYSSFGLLWQRYGEEICGSKKVADILDHKLVEVIDADDCGRVLSENKVENLYPFFLTDVIYSLLPTWKEENENADDYFKKAVELAKGVLEREIKITQDKIEAEALVAEIYNKAKDKRVIIFDEKSLPKGLLTTYPEPLFTVYLDKDKDKWRVGTIRKEERTFEVRKNFPQAWWGKTSKDLAKITGVEDAVFCRNGGIFAGAVSKEGAIKMAELALKEI